MHRRVTQRQNRTTATTTDAAGSRLPSRIWIQNVLRSSVRTSKFMPKYPVVKVSGRKIADMTARKLITCPCRPEKFSQYWPSASLASSGYSLAASVNRMMRWRCLSSRRSRS
jgi:hypothetical protein